MNAQLQLDTRNFQRALQEYQRATRKDAAEICNKTAKDVVLRAIQFTPRARKEAVVANLMRDNLAFKIVAKRPKTKEIWRAGGQKWNRVMSRQTKKMISARMRSIGYIAAGWFKTAELFGARGGRVNPRSRIAVTHGSVASAALNPVAIITNNARGASIVGLKALQDAINFVAKDKMDYARKKLAETARRYSAR